MSHQPLSCRTLYAVASVLDGGDAAIDRDQLPSAGALTDTVAAVTGYEMLAASFRTALSKEVFASPGFRAEAARRGFSPFQWAEVRSVWVESGGRVAPTVFVPDGPTKLIVKGPLSLPSCQRLTALPAHLAVWWRLELNGCRALTELPVGLSVGGGLNLIDCAALVRLPERLEIGGHLHLNNCTAITSLPRGLSVDGDCWLAKTYALRGLPEDLRVGGRLHLLCCREGVKRDAYQLRKAKRIGGRLTVDDW